MTRNETAMCMSILAAADLASRLTLPALTDKLKISCRIIFLIGAVLLTITRTLLAQTLNRHRLIMISAIYGYVRAATVVNQNLTISEYTTQDKLAGALGLNMITKGVFVITIGQLLGWIRDYTDSYPICLYAQNVLLIIVIVMWTPEVLYRKYKAYRKKQNPVDI